MLNEDVIFLKRLLKKAIEKGYSNAALIDIKIDKQYIITNAYFQLIFDIDFAKALWGEKDVFNGEISNYCLPYWKRKQWKLISVKDPIAYLREEDTCLNC